MVSKDEPHEPAYFIAKNQAVCFLCGLFLLFGSLPATVGAAPQTAEYSAKLNTTALQPGQTAVVAVVLVITPAFHTQSHAPLDSDFIPVTVMPDHDPEFDFLQPIYPPGQVVTFPALGRQSIYNGQVIIYLPLRVKSTAKLGDVNISGKLTWQACNEQACFPPQGKPFTVQTRIVSAQTPVSPINSGSLHEF